MDIYVTYKMLPCGYMYYTTCKILSANTGLGSANIQRYYTTDCTAVVSAQWNDSYTSQNKWCKTNSFLDLFVHLSYNTTCLCVILRSPLHFVSSCGLDKIRQTRKNNQLYLTTTCVITYIYLLPGSSQRCGTLRSLAWAFPTSGGELFSNNDRCYAYNDRCQGKSRVSYQPPCWELFPDNDRRSIHYPLHICTPKSCICIWYLTCVINIYICMRHINFVALWKMT